MGKRSKRTMAIALVLFYQLSSVSYASAGFFDWLADEESESLMVRDANHGQISTSESFWDKVRENSTEPHFTVISTHEVRATGYSSTPDQTDDTPFITASGTYVRDGIIAANFQINGKRVPFGTLVRIPEIYGEKVFVVEDRMNARYRNNIDIWFPERNIARLFGSKNVLIEIVEES